MQRTPKSIPFAARAVRGMLSTMLATPGLQTARGSAWSTDRRRLLTLATAVWLSFAVMQCAQTYVLSLATGRPWTLARSLVTGLPWWLSWLALTPVIAILAERYPFSSERLWGSLVRHIVAAIAVSSVHLVMTGCVYWLTTGRFAPGALTLGNVIQRYFGNFFLESIVTYAGAAGVLIAIDYARAMRDEAVLRARLEAQASALEASASKARLQALAMELNPHFLFNTLSAISGLVAQDRRAEAREVIGRLGELLRQTLGNGSVAYNSVARELDLLEDYLFIQRTRFADRLRVTIDVDHSARECLIPSMLLQPLVENAIRHGVEPLAEQGDVQIRVSQVSSSLRVQILDTGEGFALTADGRLLREGIGISNTRSRLEHLFGDNAALVLRNRHEGGAEVILVLPAIRNGAAAAAAAAATSRM